MGFLNARLGVWADSHLFHDIQSGNNSYYGVPGYSAAVGWDPASGWGTPDFAKLTRQNLVDASRGD